MKYSYFITLQQQHVLSVTLTKADKGAGGESFGDSTLVEGTHKGDGQEVTVT